MLLFIICIGAFLFYFKFLIEQPAGNQAVEIVIEDGQSKNQAISNLDNKGLIKSVWAFTLYTRIKESNFKAGDYMIPANIKPAELTDILSNKTHQVNWIMIKDGWRREQVAAYLEKNLGLSSEEFLNKTTDLEGKLYPDSYKLSDQPTVDEVLRKISENYLSKTSGLSLNKDDLILASIIQKEAGPIEDMPQIAAIFKNRIKIGMKLQSDVTAIYQKDSDTWESEGILNYKFWQPSSGVTQKYPGPFNTYSQAGLPPSPICTPSLDAINATLHPAANNYLFFLYGKDGTIHYATTQAQQDANALKYM